jgi:hypothetical protein
MAVERGGTARARAHLAWLSSASSSARRPSRPASDSRAWCRGAGADQAWPSGTYMGPGCRVALSRRASRSAGEGEDGYAGAMRHAPMDQFYRLWSMDLPAAWLPAAEAMAVWSSLKAHS